MCYSQLPEFSNYQVYSIRIKISRCHALDDGLSASATDRGIGAASRRYRAYCLARRAAWRLKSRRSPGLCKDGAADCVWKAAQSR